MSAACSYSCRNSSAAPRPNARPLGHGSRPDLKLQRIIRFGTATEDAGDPFALIGQEAKLVRRQPVQLGEHNGHLAQIPREIARRQYWPTRQASHDYGRRPKLPALRVDQQWTGSAKGCAREDLEHFELALAG